MREGVDKQSNCSMPNSAVHVKEASQVTVLWKQEAGYIIIQCEGNEASLVSTSRIAALARASLLFL